MKSAVLIDFKNFLLYNNFKTDISKLIFRDYLHLLFLKIIALIFIAILYVYFGLDRISHEIGGSETSNIILMLNVVFLAPLIEEFMFRYHQRLSYGRLIISLLFSLIMFHSSLWHFLIFAAYVGGLAFSMELKTPPTRIVLVFISALVFALIHLGNFKDLDFITEVYFIPILIFSQFLGALILSYIFWNFGLKYSIVFHMLWNTIFLVPQLLYFAII